MKIEDVVTYCEGRFVCQDGYYGRLTNGSTGCEYATLRWVWHGPDPENAAERYLTAQAINTFAAIADKLKKAGFKKPQLFWRFAVGHRFSLEVVPEGTSLRTRVFVEGCNDYGMYHDKRVENRWLKVVVDNSKPAMSLLSLKDPEVLEAHIEYAVTMQPPKDIA